MSRPNILFLTTHDMGDWIGCYGHKTLKTPNLDIFASEGYRFTNSFCTSPVCTPSRGAQMTGRYPQTNGLMGLIQPPYQWRFNKGERHLSHLLSELGYHTVLFNHQHEASHEDTLGFQELRLVNCGPLELLTGERVSTAQATAQEFAEFLSERKHEDTPFYAQVGFFETHTNTPHGTKYDWSGAQPDDSQGVEIPAYMVDDENVRNRIAGLQGAVNYLDKAFGTIISALEKNHCKNNTIVIFTVDHGIELPHCKMELYDGGIKTGLLIGAPMYSNTTGEICERLVSNVDLVPTIFDLLNQPIPSFIEGKSFADVLQKKSLSSPREAVFSMMHSHGKFIESRCVRTLKHKLIRNFSPIRTLETPFRLVGGTQKERPVLELYDLKKDPSELTNLADDPKYKRIRGDLNNMLLDWLTSVDDPILHGAVKTPYYQMAINDLFQNQRNSEL